MPIGMQKRNIDADQYEKVYFNLIRKKVPESASKNIFYADSDSNKNLGRFQCRFCRQCRFKIFPIADIDYQFFLFIYFFFSDRKWSEVT